MTIISIYRPSSFYLRYDNRDWKYRDKSKYRPTLAMIPFLEGQSRDVPDTVSPDIVYRSGENDNQTLPYNNLLETQHFYNLTYKTKYLWFRFPTDPTFFCRPYYFFNAIDLATLFSLGCCRLLTQRAKMALCCHTNYWTKLPKFVHRKYTSLVNIDVGTLLQKTAKTMKKYSK
jgi:hypothetical protein